jgi:dihydropyrimidine dehydrogenase (NAD+) subunit PreA
LLFVKNYAWQNHILKIKNMADLSINFAGIKAPNPFWLASGPPSNTGYQVMKAFDTGWGGAVWKTMGVPTINVSSRYGVVNYHKTRMVGLNNIELISDRRLSDNLRDIEEVKKHFPDHAIIASIMVQTRAEWQQIVKDVESAGVDGLELNFGCPHGMCERGMGSAVGQEPKLVELITSWVMEVATVPVIVKLTPNITDITETARAARRGGANAIALINTIQSIVGIDIDNFITYPVVGSQSTNGGYSGPAIKPIALNMVKNCALDKDVAIPISGIGGIETWRDAVEFLLLGSGSLQVCTAVMHYGFGIVKKMTSGLEQYMDEKGFKTIEEITGKALAHVTSWENLNLNNQVVPSINREKCTSCHLCYTACDDGAYQAITLSENPDDRVPIIIEEKCVGCNLCSLVCPIENCLTMVNKDKTVEVETWKQRTEAHTIPSTFNDELAGGLKHPSLDPLSGLKRK